METYTFPIAKSMTIQEKVDQIMGSITLKQLHDSDLIDVHNAVLRCLSQVKKGFDDARRAGEDLSDEEVLMSSELHQAYFLIGQAKFDDAFQALRNFNGRTNASHD